MKETVKPSKIIKFTFHGIIGLSVILVVHILTVLQIQPFPVFFTPLVWTGYIMFVDALIIKLNDESFIQNRIKEVLLMLPLSIFSWLIFELYNLHLKNWYYIGLHENSLIQLLAFCWAFATIFPGILETSELIDAFRIFKDSTVEAKELSKVQIYAFVTIGVGLLCIPLILPSEISKYLFGLLWMSFIFLLDPINYLLGQRSLLHDLKNGKTDKIFSLFLSGIVCGFLWEFWNHLAGAKWIYTLPFFQYPRVFEMPLIGFLGFPFFAAECYVMYYFFLCVLCKSLRFFNFSLKS